MIMHRALQRHSLIRSRCCLLSPIAGDEINATIIDPIRRLFVITPLSYALVEQRRSFRSTSLVSLAYPSSSPSSVLTPPTVIYSDNHLLAVNKPAGWHSVPNIPKKQKNDDDDNEDRAEVDNNKNKKNSFIKNSSNRKCLLTHLQTKGLGGGSKKDFLVPLHRIDQPCTGILLFGKTSKAASRVTTVWKGKQKKKQNNKKGNNNNRGVMKDYLCVVPTSRLGAMEEASVAAKTNLDNSDESNDSGFPASVRQSAADGTQQWNQLDGLMLRQSASSSEYGSRPRQRKLERKQQQQYYQDRLKKGRSVRIVRRRHTNYDSDNGNDDGGDNFFDYDDEDSATMRPVSVNWKVVNVPTIEPAYTLLLVRTSEGARHMVRALLAQVGDCPIIGDIRYSSSNDDKSPLKDRSVALHAYGVYFDKEKLKLGSLDTFEFRAPVPSTWKSFFGIDNHQVKKNVL